MAAPAFDHPALNSHAARSASPLAASLMAAGATLATWETRSRTRRALKEMCPSLYPDIGLTTAEVLIEVAKPFWRA
ncbi:DUF1127 domain-containing protein [Jannaschia rubra]|uniref:DUF1127 domain-containing protein n=1 Tax=Jannaschia rubra TaxID=282197 RepID=A0A0M6XU77_9RHOB|nr:hypothetical protein [Jannaschia rubra]CTQ34318.1 hypothetical protein JAN5088_03112 [Jannaschia rubra]SFG18024.1 Uncharacterized conserved protein YjiS, DUF1127 family [Jannaschia rubra]